jgi:biotin transport system substrate-specific component
MIYTLNPSIAKNIQVRILGILGFAVLTAIGAQISIPREPVPVTLQVLAVLLAGLTLGARDGFMSQVAYLSGIAAGLPIAAEGLGGLAVFGRPTAGYLYAFPLAAGVVGFLAINQNVWLRWLASVVGIIIIYIIGTTFLKYDLNLSWSLAWDFGVEPFILIDLAKAALAAACGEGLRQWWIRQYPGG